jgi:hypothetical protein
MCRTLQELLEQHKAADKAAADLVVTRMNIHAQKLRRLIAQFGDGSMLFDVEEIITSCVTTEAGDITSASVIVKNNRYSVKITVGDVCGPFFTECHGHGGSSATIDEAIRKIAYCLAGGLHRELGKYF